MRQLLRQHGWKHRLVGSDPGEIGIAPASLMGAVLGQARLTNGLGIYQGSLYLPNRDGQALEAGETITVSFAHFEPQDHFTWMGVRIHLIEGLDDTDYDFSHPWESDPWFGGGGSPTGGPETWNRFTSFAVVTNDDGETATWTFPSSGTHAEQYSWDVTGVGHIGYLLHDFSVANETGSVTIAYSGSSTERVGSHNYNTGSPVTVGAVVGEDDNTNTNEVVVTLTDDVPADSQLLIVAASQAPAGFEANDAGARPQVFFRRGTSNLIPKWRDRNGQIHSLPEIPLVGSSAVGASVDLTELPAVWGMITRSGAAGTIAVTSGALNATTTVLDHDTIAEEDGVDCDIVSSPSRIIAEEDGLYMILSVVNDADSGSSDYGLCAGIGLNSTSAIWSPTAVIRRTLNGFARVVGISVLELNAGDYVTQVFGQNSGSTKTLTYLATLVMIRIPGPITSADVLEDIDGGSP